MAQATLLLVEDFRRGVSSPDVPAIEKQVRAIPGFSEAEVMPMGRSSVSITVDARNEREKDKLKAALQTVVRGWHVMEESSYSLPRTF